MPRAMLPFMPPIRKRGPIRKDARGQISFAVVAVLLLTLAGASAILASQVNLREDDIASRRVSLEEMARYLSLVSPEIEEEAYRSGLTACEELRTLNETLLEARFQELLESKLITSYPSFKGGLKAEILNRSLHLDFLRLARKDDSGPLLKEGARWDLECSPAYFTIVGNFSVKISKGPNHLVCARTVERHIYLPSPLLLDRLGDFERSVTGGKSRLENLVRYELSSLAQWRALSGWGSSTPWGRFDISSLLSENDVRNAMGLGLLMVELECFGSFDTDSADRILDEFPCHIGALELSEMLLYQARIDPADVFLRLNGVEELDLGKVLAQALYSAFDVLALRWLDYLHILDIGQAVEGMSVGAVVALNDLLEGFTGGDNLQQASMQWMKERLDESGNLEMNYRWMNYGTQDVTVFVPSYRFEFRNYEGEEFVSDIGGYQVLDFPSFDVLNQESWKDFLVEYRQGTFRLADILHLFISSICYGIAEDCDLEPRKMVLDPFDGASMIDEANCAIIGELTTSDDWFNRGIEAAGVNVPMKDPLGQSLVEYIDGGWRQAFHMSEAVDSAIDLMAAHMVKAALASHGIFDEYLVSSYSKIVSYDMRNDPSWGARSAVEESFSTIALETVRLFSEVFGNISMQGMDGPLREALILLGQGAMEGVPGVQLAIIEACHKMLEDTSFASDLRSDETLVIPCESTIELFLEGGSHANEKLVPEAHIPWLGDRSSLKIQVKSPSDSGGLHLTDPFNASFAAYQSNFDVEVRGAIGLSLGCDGDLSDLLAISSKNRISCSLPIAFDSSLTCSSAWPLQSVDYNPTMTLGEEAGRIFLRLWQGMSKALEWVACAANSLFNHLKELLSDITSYAVQTIQEFSDLLMAIVEEARGLIDGAIGSLIGWMGSVLENLTGAIAFKLEFAGLIFLFDFSPTDIFLGRSKEYVRVTVLTDLLGAELAIGMRFVDIYRQGPDIIANITMSGDDWKAECIIDPRMMVMDHFVEVRGFFEDFVLEVTLPEVVAYEKRTLRLSDIPGLGQALSRIPVPIPGLTASIDIGFEVKYDSPIATDIVINEVELNPPGTDHGREWLELYNPSNSPVDMTDWTVRTAHGDQAVSRLDGSAIEPKSHLLVTFSEQSLDNGGESGYPLGESIALISPEGKKVDSIPFMSDHYNDGRSWQRTFDGSDRWEFASSTKDGPNGLLLVNYNELEQWERILADAVARSFAKLGQVELDLSSLAEMIKAAIAEVVEAMLQTLANALVEMSVFIEVALQDYTQSLAGRFRLSLVITGDGVKDALLWIADAIRSALANIINPAAIAPRAHSIHEILDDVYIRFGAFGTAGLPRLISSSNVEKQFSFGANVELNLACLIADPKGIRNWTVNFGALFEGVPGSLLRTIYPVDADQLVDVWLLKATLHAVRPEDRTPMH